MTSFAHVVLAVLLTLFGALPLAARQQITVGGRVVGPTGEPIAGQRVLLHRVTPGGGEMLAEATTGDDGRFVLQARGGAADSAIFFVAARRDEQLYIGPMLRPPLPEPGSYVLEVGDPGQAVSPLGGATMQGGSATIPAGAATGSPRRWLLLLAPFLGLAGLAAWGATRALGPPEDRRLLIQIARLDNEWADRTDDRSSYDRERQRLLDRLDAAT